MVWKWLILGGVSLRDVAICSKNGSTNKNVRFRVFFHVFSCFFRLLEVNVKTAPHRGMARENGPRNSRKPEKSRKL